MTSHCDDREYSYSVHYFKYNAFSCLYFFRSMGNRASRGFRKNNLMGMFMKKDSNPDQHKSLTSSNIPITSSNFPERDAWLPLIFEMAQLVMKKV